MNISTKISGDAFRKNCDIWFACTTDEILSTAVQKVRQHTETTFDYINCFSPDSLKDGCNVFCKTDYIAYLIEYMEKLNPDCHINIVTSQSDYSITNEIIAAAKSRINADFFSINCESENATPIPLGIANTFCTITLKTNFTKNNNPSRLLYVNHRSQTNPSQREWLYPHFKKCDWATIRFPWSKGKTDEYQEEMADHKFIVCPRGNGIDTHRLWEALYSGIIPVVVRHRTHNWADGNLPILFVDDYREVTESLLNQTYSAFNTKTWNHEMLDISYWMNLIRKST